MKPEPREQSNKRFLRSLPLLQKKGFNPVGLWGENPWIVRKGEFVYDLSAADLEMLDYIVEKRLFIK